MYLKPFPNEAHRAAELAHGENTLWALNNYSWPDGDSSFLFRVCDMLTRMMGFEIGKHVVLEQTDLSRRFYAHAPSPAPDDVCTVKQSFFPVVSRRFYSSSIL